MTTRRAPRRTRRVRYTAADIRHVPADQIRVGDLIWYEFDLRDGTMLYPVTQVVSHDDGSIAIVTPVDHLVTQHPGEIVDAVLADGREIVR